MYDHDQGFGVDSLNSSLAQYSIREPPNEDHSKMKIQKGYSLTSIEKNNKAKPRLKFNSKSSYLKETSLNLVKEEILAKAPYINCEFQISRNYEKEYSIDLYRRSEKEFTNLEYLSPSSHQTILLFREDEEPWLGYVTESEKSEKKPFALGLIVELYSWSRRDLPAFASHKKFGLLVTSLQMCRYMEALTNLSNKVFEEVLLGTNTVSSFKSNGINLRSVDSLNKSQNLALSTSLSHKYTVIQGPPGTGKTKTIVEMIKKMLQDRSVERVLLVASSNSSVDNVAEKFIGTSFESQSLRFVGARKSIDYDGEHVLAPICLHLHILKNLPPHLTRYMYKEQDEIPRDEMDDYKRFKKIRYELATAAMNKAKIIFCTTVCAGSGYFKTCEVPVIIMDEATQSSEPSTLIPLSFPELERFVMIGDQKQLDCFCFNNKLSMSLFQRVIINNNISNFVFLDTQYRMHPDISEFPRKRFYDGKLKDGKKSISKPRNAPGALNLYDTRGIYSEFKVGGNSDENSRGSFRNVGEADHILEVVKDLININKIAKSDIGIITPYSAQRDEITYVLMEDEEINPKDEDYIIEEDSDNPDCPKTVHYVNGITIASVDAFQGREKEVIIISCVRSNKFNNIGFLKDERRLNVAITRAQSHLFIVGDVKCLSGGSVLWRDFLKYAKSKTK